MTRGRHTFTFKINCVGGYGGIMLGVADAHARNRTIGFSPYAKGIVYGGGYGEHGHTIADKHFEKARAYVTVLVDMDSRDMAFIINGGPKMDVGMQIPEQTVAWCQLWYRGESVTIVSNDTHARGEGATAAPEAQQELSAHADGTSDHVATTNEALQQEREGSCDPATVVTTLPVDAIQSWLLGEEWPER